MQAVANSSLGNLCNQCLRVAETEIVKTATAGEFVFHHFCLHLEGPACALHHGPVWCGVAAHEDGNAYQAVVAYHADLSTRAVFHYVEQGNNGGGGEIDVVHFFPGFVKDLTERKREQL